MFDESVRKQCPAQVNGLYQYQFFAHFIYFFVMQYVQRVQQSNLISHIQFLKMTNYYDFD